MKKLLLISFICTGIVILAGCGKTIETTNDDCADICAHVVDICDAYSVFSCEQMCVDRNEQQKECATNATSCTDIENRCQSPQATDTTKNNCDAACDNYVMQCISQVPNATEALRQEAYDSCSEQCKGRNEDKTACIGESTDCPMMTNVCGL